MTAHGMTGTVSFTKMEGAGNDFIMINNADSSLSLDWRSFAASMCPPKTGIGADGVIVIEPDSETDFTFRIFNADGSEAEMCGNGARCAALFAHEQGIAGTAMRFTTLAGVIGARIDGNEVAIEMTEPFGMETGIDLDLQGACRTVHYVNTGVPHAILFTHRLDEEDVAGIGRLVRFHERFAPAGTNADFVEVQGPGCIRVRTYERGVEGETLACGTGAVASAILSHHLGKVSEVPVLVRMKGGDLKIDFTAGQKGYTRVWLMG
ncbi:MAG TPA: diaminopimelate epimerase, partial [Deltaproteobacteria bacterium]|nr:diaminopimelate epimerase [Deltaproteobacteria bacterium]